MQVEEREVVKGELLLLLLDALDLAKDNRRGVTGIETLKWKPVAKTLEKLHLLVSEYKASRDDRAR